MQESCRKEAAAKRAESLEGFSAETSFWNPAADVADENKIDNGGNNLLVHQCPDAESPVGENDSANTSDKGCPDSPFC